MSASTETEIVNLQTPFDETQIRKLKAGMLVSLSGQLYTGRDRFHKHVASGGNCPIDLRDGGLYHSGPVIVHRAGKWHVRAAGPTTSMREEPYTAQLIEQLGMRVIIGKGGMGAATCAACQKFGAVYLLAVGGAASKIAESIDSVDDVHFLEEFGAAEAVWDIQVSDFQALVAIDTHGRNLLDEVEQKSRAKLKEILAR